MFLLSASRTLAHATRRYYTSATAMGPTPNLLHCLQLSLDRRSIELIQQSHALVLSSGCSQNSFLASKLISAYATCGYPSHSQLVFGSIQIKNVYLWNSLISGYVKNRWFGKAWDLFNQMSRGHVFPDDFTLATLSKVCGELGDLVAGRLVHGKSIRLGFVMDTVVANSIASAYCKCGDFCDARKLFHEMPQRSVASWNVLIAGFASSGGHGFDKEVWGAVRCMLMEGMKPNEFTISSLLPLCDDTRKRNYGRALHCYVIRNEVGLGSDVHLGCCLIDMYSRTNKVELSRLVFDRMKHRNVFVWTSMINGYVQNGEFGVALVLFLEMQARGGIQPNRVSLVSVLPACGSFAGLMAGKQIHGFAIRREMCDHAPLSNALVDMYSKCGSLSCARRVFEHDSFCRDAISWSTMIFGYGIHGKGEEAVSLYYNMIQSGIRPQMITIVGILSACGRCGLVNEGLKIYSSVINEYGIKPTVEICSCVADMLGRSGQLDKALDFIKAMPLEPGPSVWGSLVSASVMHGHSEMQDLAYRCLIQVEPENPSNYISLSNSLASSKRWDVVAEVRETMKQKGLRKAPGCSWISLNSKVHCFYVADKEHCCSDLIYDMLDDLVLVMKGPGCSPKSEEM